MLISQLGLFAVIWVATYLVPKLRYTNTSAWDDYIRDKDQDASKIVTMFVMACVLNFGKVIII